MITKSFRGLIFWKKSKDLAVAVYKLMDGFPRSEIYGLTSQMRKAAISISSNIAESYHRFRRKEKQQLLSVAFGSGSKLESQIEMAKVLFPDLDYAVSERTLLEVTRILNSFLTK